MLLGGTIGELQQRLSFDEYYMWCRYREKYGALTPIRKYDQGFAILAAHVNNIAGGKAKPADFIFYGKDDPAEKNQVEQENLQKFIKSLGGGIKIGKRR